MKKQTAVLTLAALLLLTLTALSGCGMETEEADALIREANDTIADFQPKLSEVEGLLLTARDQAESRSGDAGAGMQRAQSLTEEVEAGITEAKGKIDEAAGLKIDDTKRQYLEAKSHALDIMLSLNGTMGELAALLAADPSAQNPETLQRWAELANTMNQQSAQLTEAEADAGKIVGEGDE